MEWYAEIVVRFARPMPVQTEDYSERMEVLEQRLSEYLGGRFEPSMIGFADRLETYAYVDAGSPEEAAEAALRPFLESAEATWGPGTTAEVLRTVTSEERDRELGIMRLTEEGGRAFVEAITNPPEPNENLRRLAREFGIVRSPETQGQAVAANGQERAGEGTKKLPTRRTSTPPGEVLLEEFLVPLGMTACELAGQIGAPPAEIEGVLRGDGAVGPAIAAKLSRRLGTTAAFWLDLQEAHDRSKGPR